MKMVLFAWEWKIISISKAEHLTSFWYKGPGELGNGRLRAVSLFSWSVEQNARDTQMTTRVTEGARRERLFFLLGLPPSFLVSGGFAAQSSRARALPLLNLKKKRDYSQSTEMAYLPVHAYPTCIRIHSRTQDSSGNIGNRACVGVSIFTTTWEIFAIWLA